MIDQMYGLRIKNDYKILIKNKTSDLGVRYAQKNNNYV